MADRTFACPECGEPLQPHATACTSCGRIVREAGVKPNRLLPQVGAAVAGGVIGLICGFLYSLAIFTLALDHSYSPPPSPSPDPGIVALFTIGAIVPVASCLFFGIGLARSGRRIEAAFVIAFGIGASSPQAACDVGSLVSLHH